MDPIAQVEVEIATATPLTQVIVRVRDESGLTGVGEAWWGIPDRERPGATARPIAATIEDLIAPRLLGRDPGQIERLWFDLWDYGYRYADQGIFMMALSGVDIALWDLKGKRLGVSVAELLGGVFHDGLPAYASLPPLRNVSQVVRQSERAVEAGLTAVKLHELSIEYVQALRDRFGNGLQIMVDVNGHFDPLEAIELGRQLGGLGVTWFEEPVRPMRDHRALRRVRDAAGVPLAAGENEYTLDDFNRLLASGAIEYLQPEITKVGGLTAARRIGTLAELYNVALSPHNFRCGPSLYASIHWGMASPASRWIELPWLPEGAGPASGTPLPPLRGGRVFLPEGPGLGLPAALEQGSAARVLGAGALPA